MESRKKLKAFFDSKQEDEAYIQKYEENKHFFDQLLFTGHVQDIEFVLAIKLYQYTDPLNKTGKLGEALTALKEVEQDIAKLKGKSKLYDQLLEGATYMKGVCLSKLKRYQASNEEFKKLLTKDPGNKNFIVWYKRNQKNHISRILGRITYIGIAYYLIMLALDVIQDSTSDYFSRNIGLVIALAAAAISYLWRGSIDHQKIKFN